jgi:dCTP deaminase
MVLCDTEIRAAIYHKHVIIDPEPPPEHITTSALDLMLGSEFAKWKPPQEKGVEFAIDPSQPGFFQDFSSSQFVERIRLTDGESVVVQPGDFLLGITRESIQLPRSSRLAARVEGRSSLARLGLGVHVTAPTIHAGFRGHIALEITNQGPLPIRLRPGLRICQLIFEQVFGTPSMDMAGIFQDQTSPAGGTRDQTP